MAEVSVITLALNAADTIEEALRSVLPQDGVGEVVVVDDGSTDATADVVRAIRDPRIRIIPGPRAGFTAALNCGLRAARLEFVALCDSDDWWSEGRLDWQRRWMAAHPGHIAVSGGFASATPEGAHVADLAVDRDPGDVTTTLQRGETVTSFCTWLTRREALEAAGFARGWFETSSDLDLQFRLADLGAVWHEPLVCYHYRLHAASVTHRQPAPRRVFFEDAARRFAHQRQAGAPDDLAQGTPPVFARDTDADAPPSALEAQIAGQLVGVAWREAGRGETRAAFGTMLRAVRQAPGQASTWWNFAKLLVRSVVPGRR